MIQDEALDPILPDGGRLIPERAKSREETRT